MKIFAIVITALVTIAAAAPLQNPSLDNSPRASMSECLECAKSCDDNNATVREACYIVRCGITVCATDKFLAEVYPYSHLNVVPQPKERLMLLLDTGQERVNWR
jgi:hypothetical protein